MIPRPLPVAGVLLTVALAGCGLDRAPVPDNERPAPPSMFNDLNLGGVSARVPANWRVQPGDPPQLAIVASGNAQIALWRYQRTEPMPNGKAALERARNDLVAAIKLRDPSVEVIRSRRIEIGDTSGVELVAKVTLEGQPRQVRSTHLYAEGSEVVLDLISPAEDFPTLDRSVWRTVQKSVVVQPVPANPAVPAPALTTPATPTTPPTP